MNPLGQARIDGPQPDQVILVGGLAGTLIRNRSRRCPDILFVHLYSNAMARGGIVISPPRQVRLVMLALAGRFGQWVDKLDLVDMLWGDDPDGGPDNAIRTVDVYIVHARSIAALIGYRIETRKQWGAVRAYPVISARRERSAA